MNSRQSYLKNEWKPYPGLDHKVFTVKDFVKKYALVSSGKDKIKDDFFWLAGRIFKAQSNDGTYYYSIESHSESLGLEFKMDAKLSNNISNADILETGDQILIKCMWQEVRVEGYDVKVKEVIAHHVSLLAPCLEPYCIDNFNYKKSKQWQFFLQQVRRAFQVLDFVEVHTPTLVQAPGTETFLDHFRTEFKMGSRVENFYLPTSPELHLKKMIAAGWTRIFEIKNCFRNGELSEKHQPEFWMLEWYRAYTPFETLIKDIQGILNLVKLHWPEPIIGFGPIQQITISELFKEYVDFELTPSSSMESLKKVAAGYDIEVAADDSWDDVFHRIFIEKIEPHLGFSAPVVVKDYPPSQAALARINDRGWADRFEFYWKGLEIANAFYELNDPVEQEKRFYEDIAYRKKIGRQDVPVDEEFLRALRSGFPPTAGIALGLDRLFMAVTGFTSIDRTRAFPIKI